MGTIMKRALLFSIVMMPLGQMAHAQNVALDKAPAIQKEAADTYNVRQDLYFANLDLYTQEQESPQLPANVMSLSQCNTKLLDYLDKASDVKLLNILLRIYPEVTNESGKAIVRQEINKASDEYLTGVKSGRFTVKQVDAKCDKYPTYVQNRIRSFTRTRSIEADIAALKAETQK